MIKTYHPPKGTIHGHKPQTKHMINLKRGLPLGIIGVGTEQGFHSHALVTKCGEEEAWCLKQQSIEVDPKEEHRYATAYLILMAETMAGYLRHGFGGTFIPTLYRRNKPNGLEIGIAYFGKPSPTGIEASEFEPQPVYDRQFGNGFFTMFHHYYEELKKTSNRTNIPLRPVIGLDTRKSSHLDGIQVQMIAQGRTLFVCNQNLTEESIILSILASCGLEDFVHLPCLHIEIDEKHRDAAMEVKTEEEIREENRKKLQALKQRAETLKQRIKDLPETDEQQ